MHMLTNSLAKERLAHAYLFEGPKGTGKRELAQLLAKSLYCLERDGVAPCDRCLHCQRIQSGNFPDVRIVEPDGQSIKKEQIEWLQQEFQKKALESAWKVYILVHADKMTTNAANSLLKFLEEPLGQTVAILITENPHKMLNTILSRCQQLSFQPLPAHVVAERLIAEGVAEQNARLASELSNDWQQCLQMTEDDWFAQAQLIVIQLYEALQKDVYQALFHIHDAWMPHFKEKEQLQLSLDLLLFMYRDLYTLYQSETAPIRYVNHRVMLQQSLGRCTGKTLANSMAACLAAKARLNTNMNPQLLMEQLVLTLQEGSSLV